MYSVAHITPDGQSTTGGYQNRQQSMLTPLGQTVRKIQSTARPSFTIANLNALMQASEPKTVLQSASTQAPSTEETATFIIDYFSETCRVMTVNKPSEVIDFHSALQLCQEGQWKTIMYYEFACTKAYRYTWKQNGLMQPFPINLPLYVVTEMAHEDFSRNWSSYCREFGRRRI